MVAVFKEAPLVLHLFVQFQLRAGFCLGDAHLMAALEYAVHQHGVYTFVLVIRADGNQEKIQRIVLSKCL